MEMNHRFVGVGAVDSWARAEVVVKLSDTCDARIEFWDSESARKWSAELICIDALDEKVGW